MHTILLNKIKILLAENCKGTGNWSGLGSPKGLTFTQICRELYDEDKNEIEMLLKLESQTFGYNVNTSCWLMFPEIVDTVKSQINDRKSKMAKVWDNTNLSHFISYTSYKKILFFEKAKFENILNRCKEIGNCDYDKLQLPSDEIWNIILFSSDKEFQFRLGFMKTSAPPVLDNSDIFYSILSACAIAGSKLHNEYADGYDDEEDDESDILKIRFADFVIKCNVFMCNQNHNIEQIQALIDVMTPSGEIVTKCIPAGYCKNCDCYFILERDYMQLRAEGILLCQQISYDVYRKKGLSIISGDELKPESLLYQCGYNVSAADDLSSVQRREILCRVVDNGLYSISGICSHLDWLIGRNKKITDRDMNLAISKWQEDRNFISQYNKNSQRNITVSSIKRTNYK